MKIGKPNLGRPHRKYRIIDSNDRPVLYLGWEMDAGAYDDFYGHIVEKNLDVCKLATLVDDGWILLVAQN